MGMIELLLEQGAEHHRSGRLAPAERCYRGVLEAHPEHPDAIHGLGVLALQTNQHDLAVSLLEQAIALKPDIGLYFSHLTAALNHLKRFDDAVAAGGRAVALAPGLWQAHHNFGNALKSVGKVEEGIGELRRALELDPAAAVAWRNLADAQVLAGRPADALVCLDHALALEPWDGDARFVRGTTRLQMGDWAGGWEDYEYRYALPWTVGRKPRFLQPLWDGESLDGKTILIHDEQGFGDTFQFARFIPQVKALGARVYFQVIRDLVGLFQGFPGIDGVFERGVETPPFDVWSPLMSLPRVLGTRVDTIPGGVPYFRAERRRAQRWRRRLDVAAGLKVGLVWAGTPTLNGDHWRSPGLKALAPLLEVPGVTFFALQVGHGRRDLDGFAAPANFVDLGADINGFDDTAAIMAGLDLVVSSCTAPLHLAGAMGRPVWALLSSFGDWRWLEGRADSPWYPTMRLFRQKRLGDWEDVVAEMGAALQ